MGIAKLLPKRRQRERIILPATVAADFFCLARLECCAVFLPMAKRRHRSITGFVKAAGISLSCK